MLQYIVTTKRTFFFFFKLNAVNHRKENEGEIRSIRKSSHLNETFLEGMLRIKKKKTEEKINSWLYYFSSLGKATVLVGW